MKKLLYSLGAALMGTLMLASCDKDKYEFEPIGVTGIEEFNNDSYTVACFDTIYVPIAIVPDSAYRRQVLWTSSDEEIAKAFHGGMIVAFKPGQTTITATSYDGKYSTSCEVTVTPKHASELNITSKAELELMKGTTSKIEYQILPAVISDEVSFQSSNPEVASVSDGIINALKGGTAVITVKVGSITKEINVTVINEMIQVNSDAISLEPGQTFAIEAKVVPTKDDATYTFASANQEVATVSAEGVVTAVAKGDTKITITSGELTKEVAVRVSGVFDNFYVALGGENLLNVSSVMIDGEEQTGLAKNNFQPSAWNAVGEFIKVKLEKGQTVSYIFQQPTQGVSLWNSWGLAFWDGFEDYTKSKGNFVRADNWLNSSTDAGFIGGLYNGGGRQVVITDPAPAVSPWADGWDVASMGHLLPTDKNVKVSISLSNDGVTTLVEEVESEPGTWTKIYSATFALPVE